MKSAAGRQKELDKYLRMIRSFKKRRVLVIGDVMLDEYVWGTATRISPEAPVPVVVVKDRTFNAGGAANTVTNIMSLGAEAALMGVIGRDPNGRMLKSILKGNNIDTKYISTDDARPTTYKIRIIAQGQQVMRTDQEDTCEVDDRMSAKMLRQIERMIDGIDGIAISDYDKGVIGPHLMSGVISIAKQKKKIVVADLKPQNAEWFKGVTLVTPNRFEASLISGVEISDEKTLLEAGHAIRERMRTAAVLVTLGEGGMALFTDRPGMDMIPAVSTQVYDVTGAGDTVLAAAALGLSAGHPIKDSVKLANYAAGVVVRKRGTASVSADELADFIKREARF